MMAFRTLRWKCALLAPMCLMALGVARNAAADTITVGWDQGSSTVGYRVHIGVQSGNYTQHIDVGSATIYAFTTATAGQRYCFAVSAYLLSTRLEGPNSNEVCGYSNQAPTLVNPGARTSTVGQPTSLQLQGFDSQPLTYSASGLPPGLSVGASTGYISGTGTTAGTYNVTARASDGVLSTSQTFSWTMTTASTSGGSTSGSTGGSTGGTTTPPPSGPDYTRPTVTIASPTTNTTYSYNGSTLALSGTTYDAVGVTQVRWENDAMRQRGIASGLTNWTACVPLQAGSNLIYITAIDAAGNEGVDFLTVSVSSTGGSTCSSSTGGTTGGSTGGTTTGSTGGTTTGGSTGGTVPTGVTIVTPTTGTTYTTTQSTISLTGTASVGGTVNRVVWENVATGNRGYATGTTSWAIANIPLAVGSNYIEITMYDNAGTAYTDRLTVTRSTSGSTSGSTTTTTPPPDTSSTGAPPTLRLEPTTYYGLALYWTSTSWSSVDVYRSGTFVKRVSNTGSTTDSAPGGGSYSYKLCAPGSTTNCSNSVNISF